MKSLRAAAVALPVVEFAGRGARGKVMGGGASVAYADLDGFVVAITCAGVPLMPNGIAIDSSRSEELPPRGTTVVLSPEGLMSDSFWVDLRAAPRWSPRAPLNSTHSASDVFRRGKAMRESAGDPTLNGAAAIGEAIADGDPEDVVSIVRALIGRGGGLTPAGDDLLAGICAGLFAFSGPAGLEQAARDKWLESLCPPWGRSRTTSLSATLLELARRGFVAEPLRVVLDLAEPPSRWWPALQGLLRVGHSTGPAWAFGCGIAATSLSRVIE